MTEKFFSCSKKDVRLIRKYLGIKGSSDQLLMESFVVECMGNMEDPNNKLKKLREGDFSNSKDSHNKDDCDVELCTLCCMEEMEISNDGL